MANVKTSVRKRLLRAQRRRSKKMEAKMFARTTTPFRYDASLRIQGIGTYHHDIVERTGIVATCSHRCGELRRKSGKVYTEDLWILSSPLGERASLSEHLCWLWETVSPHKKYFDEVIGASEAADICLGCLSESSFPFLELSEPALEMMREMKLGFTFNFTCL